MSLGATVAAGKVCGTGIEIEAADPAVDGDGGDNANESALSGVGSSNGDGIPVVKISTTTLSAARAGCRRSSELSADLRISTGRTTGTRVNVVGSRRHEAGRLVNTSDIAISACLANADLKKRIENKKKLEARRYVDVGRFMGQYTPSSHQNHKILAYLRLSASTAKCLAAALASGAARAGWWAQRRRSWRMAWNRTCQSDDAS